VYGRVKYTLVYGRVRYTRVVYARYTMVGITASLPWSTLCLPGYTPYIPDAPRCVLGVRARMGVTVRGAWALI